MNWKVVEDTIKSVIVSITELKTAGAVAWEGQSDASTSRPSPRVDLNISGHLAYGDDEVRYEEPTTAGQERKVTICGQRSFTLSVKIESFSQKPETSARHYMDRLRTRLWREGVCAQLRSVGLAMSDILSVVEQEFIKDNRRSSYIVMDIRVLAVENDVDTTPGAGRYISTVELSSNTLKTAVTVPATTQIDEEIGE